MPERFSRDSRLLTFLAHEHAFRLHHDGVGASHLVLALLDDDRGLALLKNGGADIDVLRQALGQRMLPEPERARTDAVLPKTSTLHKAWGDAHEIADRSGARSIEPEHLLLALVPEDEPLSNTAKDLIASGFGRT